jgi:MFS family permease
MSRTANEKLLIIKENNIAKEYEQAIEDTNLNGKFQKTAFKILGMTAFLSSLILAAFPLQKEIPKYECFNRQDFEDFEEYNIYKNTKRYKIIHAEECVKRYCSSVKENFEDPTLWVLVADYYSITNIITSLDVMCDFEKFNGEFTRMLFLGRIVGTIFYAYISDTYGRRVMFSLGIFILLVTNVSFFFLTYEFVYYIIAFFSVTCFSLYNLVTIMSVEIMSNDLYSFLNGLCGSSFAISGLLSLFIMFLFKSWFILLGFHIIVDSVILYFNYAKLTETPKFCLAKKDYKKLDEILLRIAKENNTFDAVSTRIEKIRSMINLEQKDCLFDNYKAGILNMLNPVKLITSIFAPYVRILTSEQNLGNFLKLVIPFVTIVFIYYGTLMFIEKIPGDVKLNSLLIFVAQALSPNLGGYLLKRHSRKFVLYIFHIICIICSLLFISIQNEIVLSLLIFVNSFSVCIAFVATYVITAEIFDSSVKTSAMSILLIIANLPLVFGEFLMNVFPSPFYWFAILCTITIFSLSGIKEKQTL